MGRLKVVRGACCLGALGMSSIPLAIFANEHTCSPAQLFTALSGENRAVEDISGRWKKPAVIIDYRGDASVWAFQIITVIDGDVADFAHGLTFNDFQSTEPKMSKEAWLTFVNGINLEIPLGSVSYVAPDNDGSEVFLGLRHRFLLEGELCEPSQLRKNFLKFDESVGYLIEKMKALGELVPVKTPELCGGLGV